MQDEIETKDFKIQDLENDIEMLEEVIMEQDRMVSQQKEKITEIK